MTLMTARERIRIQRSFESERASWRRGTTHLHNGLVALAAATASRAGTLLQVAGICSARAGLAFVPGTFFASASACYGLTSRLCGAIRLFEV